jgi:MazG family protein
MPIKKSKHKRRIRKPSVTKTSKRVTPPTAGPAFQRLVTVMSRLRAPKGCPWDREQTHATLRTYLIEEAYEVLDALDSTDDAKFAEELGDLLLQVLFHAQIAHEEGRFDITTVIREIYDKMIRRHPHVFGTTSAKTAADVLRNWEEIKQQERSKPLGNKNVSSKNKTPLDSPSGTEKSVSVLDGVPRTLPALLEALQLTRKAARIGFDWPNMEGIFDKLQEETQELQAVLAKDSSCLNKIPSGTNSTIESELGDILFVVVNLARFLDLDPEIALKKTSQKFSRRFRSMEQFAREKGTTLAQIPRPQMESLWDQAKLQEQLPRKK